MAKDPAVLFYTSDFLTGTSFFTMEQRGQYITLLCQQHQLGIIPENHMISICGSLDSPVISKFIKDDNGNYYNDRMRLEAERRKNYCKSRGKNKKGKKKQESYDKTHENHMNLHMETENETENIDINKDEFEFNKDDQTFFDFLCRQFKINEITNPDKYLRIGRAITLMKNQSDDRYRYFKDNCYFYFKYKSRAQEKIHNLNSFLGDLDQKCENGGWNNANWLEKGKELPPDQSDYKEPSVRKRFGKQNENPLIQNKIGNDNLQDNN
jgi:uncharacterized protein YdaU (DUF1376 family)